MKINVEKSNVTDWLDTLSKMPKEGRNGKLSKRIYALVAVPSRRRRSVNLDKINKYTKDGDNVIVPGKVLSDGRMEHKINIAAMEFSGKALKLLKESDCKISNIKEMLNSQKVHVVI